MTVSLHPYQSGARDSLRALAVTGHRRLLLVLPTGAGKTTVAADLITRCVARGGRALFIAHRTELIEQAIARLATFGLDAGRIQAAHTRTSSPIQVASIATMVRRELPPADLVIVDEAHRVKRGASYDRVLAGYPRAIVVGLTATPIRMDGRGLGDLFDRMVVGPSVRDLITVGVLCESDVWSHASVPDLAGIKTVAGDYARDRLAEMMDRPELVGDVIQHWRERADGMKTVCFASSIAHSRSLVSAWLAAGVSAAHLDGETDADARTDILARLREGSLTVVSNYGVLTEGWDLPDCAALVCARPTKSLGLWLQMAGRVLRTAPGKGRAIILDHGGNAVRHGLPDSPREWAMATTPPRAAEEAAKVRQCLVCYAVFPPTPGPCPYCGADRAEAERREIAHRGGALVLMVGGREADPWLAQIRPVTGSGTASERDHAISVILAEAQRRGLKTSKWAKGRYHAAFGVLPRGVWLARIRDAWPDEPRGEWDHARGEVVYRTSRETIAYAEAELNRALDRL